MRHIWITALVGLTLQVSAQDDLINRINDNGSESGPGYQFETLIDLEATPIRNQGSSGTCWSYATSSFIESEMIRMGKDPVDISEMFTVRQVYVDKADKYVRLHGHLNFAQGGALPDVLHVIKYYGAVPEEAYSGLNYGTELNSHGELEAALKGIVDAVIKNKNRNTGGITPVWKAAFEAYLDQYLGSYPDEFTFQGKNYTPRSFADEYLGIVPDDYVQLTSWLHHPMHKEVQIQVPDNWTWGSSYNLPLNDMLDNIDHALENGYTVAWAADVSEKGFSLRNGLAIAPAMDWNEMSDLDFAAHFSAPQPEMEITPEIRQQAYDNYQTTDDHAMQITGKVRDQNGNVYYIVKNSWGDRENEYRTGYLYVSRAYVAYKTISVMMHRDALNRKVALGH